MIICSFKSKRILTKCKTFQVITWSFLLRQSQTNVKTDDGYGEGIMRLYPKRNIQLINEKQGCLQRVGLILPSIQSMYEYLLLYHPLSAKSHI